MRKLLYNSGGFPRGGARLGYHCFALDRVEPEHAHLAGERVALLALAKRKGFAVPPGFVVLGKTFGDLVRDTELKLLFPSLEKRMIARTLPMEAIGVELRKLIAGVKVPPHIMLDVDSGAKGLGLGDRTRGHAVTVRACTVDARLSSASLERAVAVTRMSDMEARLKDCWASAFDAENLEAIRHHRIEFADAGPAVLVSQTVAAEVSGVMFSHAPLDAGHLLIEAVWGFHEALGEGKFFPSRYFVARAAPSEVRAEEAAQAWEYAQGPQGPLVRVEVPPDRQQKPKLSKLMLEELSRAGLELEKLVGGPIGVEWAVQGGVVFILQVVRAAGPEVAPGEAEGAERHIEAVEAAELHRQAAEAAERVARAPSPASGPPPQPSRAPPAAARRDLEPPKPEPKRTAAPPRVPRLLPVIQSSLFVELPPGAGAEEARHLPHAGLVIDAQKWRAHKAGAAAFAGQLAAAAVAVFPRPVLVEVADVDPSAHEALRETAARGGPPSEGVLERLLGAMMEDLRTVAAARGASGATNLHVIAPFVKSEQDASVLDAAMGMAGLGSADAPRTLAFSELRNPSTLLYNVDAAESQDGIIVRADRFYKALVREGDAQGEAGAPQVPSPSFVRALFELTRAFERAGGTVLVLLETEGDLNTIWFYRELGVDGFIARREDAEACARHLFEAERRKPYAAKRRGRGG